MKAACGVEQVVLGVPEENTPATRSYVRTPRREALAQMGEAALPFPPEAIRFSVSARGCRLELPLAPGEDVYGLGLQLKSLRHTGKKRTLRVNSDPVADTGDSHAPAPLYFSTAGYGVMVDTARYATFYCGGNELRDQAAATAAEPGKIALSEAELYASGGVATAPMVIDIPAAQGVTLYFFSGPTLAAALRRYVLFCGGGCLPPEWGLGVWYRTCGSSDAAGVRKMASELRERRIPCDVLGLEPGWQSKAYSCSYVWSPERFPEPAALTGELTAQGYHVNLWEHAFVHPTSPLYRPLLPWAGDFLVWKGLVPDLGEAPAAELFSEYHHRSFTGRGISSFKLDECDNSDFIASPWSFPECSHFPGGTDGECMHSMFGMHYMAAITEACRRAGVRTYGSVRNAHLFAPPSPYVLYSDLYNHRDFLRGVASAGFSGMLWTPELRHAESREDYLRRLEAMVLSPQMLLNIWSMPHPPWRQLQRERNIAGEFYPEAEERSLCEATRKLLELRMSFLPYLYNAFADYHFRGDVPFRAPVVDDPENPALRDVDTAWLVGADLLVAPFVAGEGERVLPLPAGVWRDFYTGTPCEGEVRLSPSPETLPILVRDNAIIPFAEPVLHTGKGLKYRLRLLVFGPSPRPARLFADDGETLESEELAMCGGQVGADGVLPSELAERYEVVAVERRF